MSFTLAWLTKACNVGMVPSSSEFYPQMADTKVFYLSMAPSSSNVYPRVAHKRLLSGGSQQVCYIGMCPSSSKLYLWLAYQSYATFDCLLPLLNFNLEGLRKSLLPWNGPCILYITAIQFYPCAHKRSATLEQLLPALKLNLRWLTKGLLHCNGSFFL